MIVAFTITDRQGRILISAIEEVVDNQHADELITNALLKLSACECVVTEYKVTENLCQHQN